MNDTTTDALDLAARLDGAVVFLGFLGETPWFAHQQAALDELLSAVATARDDLQARHGLGEREIDERQGRFMRELGLLGQDGYTIEPGFGRDVAQLYEQLRQLAERVIGVEWSLDSGCYVSCSSGESYA